MTSKTIYDFDKGVRRRGADAKEHDPSLCPGDMPSFWTADTDFPSSAEVTEALRERVEMNHYGYPHIDPVFEESIVRWHEVGHNMVLSPEYIDFSLCVILAMIWPAEEFSSVGDKAFPQTLVYLLFRDLVRSNGHQLIYSEVDLVNGRYEASLRGLGKKLSDPKVKTLFICNP